ncbi:MULTISPECIES: sigma-70 family RNA polymerase sigma factor [Bacillus cereus group]|uniref:Sigma-70 family RNA polymerase sigma factor n=1 Tax=Bacillus proteolyticus TaxID=2026192 RepID=A0ABV3IAD0_9BACI|nr:sigma-70 family RNA polymerase sigma factor [Bacillus cereus group sp. N8]MBJ8105979.1 sigma-70 family RNA polymerase sigma factor [Bacillus cereus group sp. N8]
MAEVVDVKAMSDDEFMKKYKKLVYNFVWKKYSSNAEVIKSNTGLEIDDLIQYGMIGLLKARKGFDPTYGCEFSNYAIPKIFGIIAVNIRDAQKVKVPRDVYYLKGKIMNRGLLEEKPEEISKRLDVSIQVVEEALRYQHITKSIHEIAHSSGNSDDDLTIEQMLVDEYSASETEEVEREMLMGSFVQTLPDREMIVWDMYSNHMSQESIGKKVGVTQTQISRILKRIKERAATFGKAQGVAK